jgi:hypothetical protein
MNRDKLKAAIDEANRFLARAKALPKPVPYSLHSCTYENDYFPKEQGSIMRASMDLTRALADLRKATS